MKKIDMAEIKLTEAEINAAVNVLRSGALRQGEECNSFEKEFADYSGSKYAVTSSNGSASLHLAYMTFLKPGDEVLVPSFTFIATGSMVAAAGGIPVFCDVDPETYLIDLHDAERKITEKTVAISPVHLFGNVVNPVKMNEFADKFGLRVVWDAAQAHGATFNGKGVGGFGGFTSFSFYPSKNMFVGEGGITLTDEEDLATQMRYHRSHGQTGKYLHTMDGLNYRMTDVEAAIGREQLKRLDDMLERRRSNAVVLNNAVDSVRGLRRQKITDGTEPSWHQYCIVVDNDVLGFGRDELAQKLNEKGIATGVHYPRGMHQQPVFIDRWGYKKLEVTESLCASVVAIPVHHGIDDEGAKYIADTLIEIAG